MIRRSDGPRIRSWLPYRGSSCQGGDEPWLPGGPRRSGYVLFAFRRRTSGRRDLVHDASLAEDLFCHRPGGGPFVGTPWGRTAGALGYAVQWLRAAARTARATASTEASMLAAPVDQLLIDTRMTARSCQRDPDIQVVPSASNSRTTASVR